MSVRQCFLQNRHPRLLRSCTLLIVVLIVSKAFLSRNGNNESNQSKTLITSRKLRPRSPDPDFQLDIDPSMRLVILVCKFRSGSTFLGELFNQNPSVTYDFESFHRSTLSDTPLRMYHTVGDRHVLYLQRLLHNCSLGRNGFGRVMNKHYRCGRNPSENLHLFGKEICDESTITNNTIPKILSDRHFHCRNRDITAMKVIRLRRLRDIMRIRHLATASNVKIIHYLRDIRGMENSRFLWPRMFLGDLKWREGDPYQKFALEAYDDCAAYTDDLKLMSGDDRWRERYYRLEYDEISGDLEKWAKNIYQFVGIPLPSVVRDWIKNVVEGNAEGNRFQEGLMTGLSTKKNPKTLYKHWLKLNHNYNVDKIRNTDTQCASVIRKLGWEFYLDPERPILAFDMYRHNERLNPKVQLVSPMNFVKNDNSN